MSNYHYTKGCHLSSIVNEGVIRTSSNLLDRHEKPAVWLTKSPEWEVACNVGLVTNINDLQAGQVYTSKDVDVVTTTLNHMKKEIGMCRILINEKLSTVSWAKFKHVSGISERVYQALDEYSKSKGCPVNQWLCTFSAISKKYWEGIEMYVDNQWVRWDESVSIEEFIDLCMSCNNSNYQKLHVESKSYPKHYYREASFLDENRDEIIKFWEANKHKKGYIQIYIDPEYMPYKRGFEFIEKRIKKSSFMVAKESKTDNYALVHFLWEATHTQYKAALAYEKEKTIEPNSVLNN